jgi:hypothetical protein
MSCKRVGNQQHEYPEGFKRSSAVTYSINSKNPQNNLNFETLSKQLQNTLYDSIKTKYKVALIILKQNWEI